MKFEEYISHVYEGENPDSPYQYAAKHAKEYYAENEEALEQELKAHFVFWLYLCEVKYSQRRAFLDYHLHMYDGEGMDFWYFIKQSPARPIDPDLDDHLRVMAFLAPETGAKVEWLEEMKDKAFSRKGTSHTLQAPPERDDRLQVLRNGDLVDASEVREWFREELLLKKFNGKPIISLKDFDAFLCASFANFETAAFIPANRKLVVNADGAFLKNLMYRFYLAHRKGGQDKALKSGLSAVLKNIFDTFKDQEELTIEKSMHRVYKPRTN